MTKLLTSMIRVTGAVSFGLAAVLPVEALATEGYFQAGYGAIQKSLAGTGVANPEDATALAFNPAGLAFIGRQFNGSVSLFAPQRQYDATGTVFVAPGKVESGNSLFAIPSLAYSQPIDPVSAIGIALYGNGGLDTSYQPIANLAPGCGRVGVFCGGKAGVDLQQAFLTAGYARRFGDVSIGIAPVVAFQLFKAYGLGAYAPLSFDPTNLTNKGYDTSVGIGLRGGVQWNVVAGLRLGVSAATPTYASAFDKYRGLFADQGSFDVPGNVTVGFAWDASRAVTLLADYKHIFYSGVDAVGNSSTIPLPLGTSGGPGFGWHDVDVFSFGGEWRASPDWTVRLGYAHATNPIRSTDVTLNILAPGVVTDHFSSGFSYRVTRNSSIDFAAVYVPRQAVSGPEVTPAGITPRSNITLSMAQLDLTVGWTYKFDVEPERGVALLHK